MQMLQDVLFRQYCQNHPINHQTEMRKYKHRIKKQSQPETHDLPVYILEKFRSQRLSPVRDQSNKAVLQKDHAQSQIFMQRSKMTKYRQSLSPLKTNKNLREYSNLLFVKKNYQQLKMTRNDHFQTLHQKSNQQKYSTLSTLSFYNQPSQSKTLKEMQPNTSQLQINRLPIIGQSKDRRKQYIEALQMQHLTATNLLTHYPTREKGHPPIRDRHQETIQICGWKDGDLFQ